MADGFTLTIDEDLARDLERRAEAAGMSREELARRLLAQDMLRYEDFDWIGGDPRASAPEPEAPEPTYALAEVASEFRAELEDRLARKS